MHKPRLSPILSSALLAALAGLAASAAHADEFYGGDKALQFESSRSRAEVMAEAARIPATRSLEPAGSRVYSLSAYAPRPAAQTMGAGPAPAASRDALRNDYLQRRVTSAAWYGEDSGSFELSRRGWGSLATPQQPQQ